MFDPITEAWFHGDDVPKERCVYDSSAEAWSVCDSGSYCRCKSATPSAQLAINLAAQMERGEVPDSPGTLGLIQCLMDLSVGEAAECACHWSYKTGPRCHFCNQPVSAETRRSNGASMSSLVATYSGGDK